jgi:hypothetical protein
MILVKKFNSFSKIGKWIFNWKFNFKASIVKWFGKIEHKLLNCIKLILTIELF